MIPRLCTKNLKGLAPLKGRSVEVPTYDRTVLKPGHIHFGFGNFFPAFTAYKTHQLLQLGNMAAQDYGIVAVNINRTDRSEQINPQDGLYTIVETDNEGLNRMIIVGSVLKFVFAPKSLQAVIDLLASSETRIVSLTITPQTQHSYRDANGNLNLDHPDIQHDLEKTGAPKTVMGYLVLGFKQRELRGLPGFTVMNLDNIEHNGNVFKKLFLQFVRAYDETLLSAADAKLSFPNSMVDRIVPKTTPELLELVSSRLGLQDMAAVSAEPMPNISWALEGKGFVNGRPAWEKLRDVKISDDVTPFEMMKLRLLNASRFGVGHLGDLKGYKLFDDAANDPLFQEFMFAIMKNEAEPTLKPLPNIDLAAYEKELVARCANRALKDSLARTTKEGPIKNVLNIAQDQLELKLPIDLRALEIAAWMRRCRGGKNEAGGEIVFEHPLAAILKKKALEGGNDASALFGVTEIFGAVGQQPIFIRTVGKYLALLEPPNGVDVAIRTAIDESNRGGSKE